jgi:hypothetical protein
MGLHGLLQGWLCLLLSGLPRSVIIDMLCVLNKMAHSRTNVILVDIVKLGYQKR